MSAKTLAFANHKGGVGKTTSTASIGFAMAAQGRKVLLIDLDAQQNLTFSLTRTEHDKSIYDVLVRGSECPLVVINDNVTLIPAGIELARAEIDMSTRMARERMLLDAIKPLKERFDYILIDCPPSLGIITTNALVASDSLYIPLTAEALPMKGMSMLNDFVDEIKRLVNHRLRVGGVFFTRYNNRNLNREVMDNVRQNFGSLLCDTIIRENISLAEVPLSGNSIFEYAPKSNGALDYERLTDEIIKREEQNQTA